MPFGPRLPTGTREQDIVKAILQFLALHKIPSWRMNTGGTRIDKRFIRFGAVGMSDIIGILRLGITGEAPHLTMSLSTTPIERWPAIFGRFLAIEVKSAKGTVTPAQQAFLDTVNGSGGKAFVARSVEDVRKALGL